MRLVVTIFDSATVGCVPVYLTPRSILSMLYGLMHLVFTIALGSCEKKISQPLEIRQKEGCTFF